MPEQEFFKKRNMLKLFSFLTERPQLEMFLTSNLFNRGADIFNYRVIIMVYVWTLTIRTIICFSV